MSNDRSKLHHLVPAPWGNSQEGERSQTTIPRRVRPKNASRACNECQKRKIKCIGSNPCKNCHENSLYCEINDETDGRRRFALKRKVDDLEQDRNLLLGLLDALRDDEPQAMQFLNLVRSNASLEDIRLAVHNRTERLSMPTSSSAPIQAWPPSLAAASAGPFPLNQVESQGFQTSETISPRKIMDIDRLTDIPLIEVSAKTWTDVTTDDGFVSHLISLWLTWDHICQNWIDKDLFLAALKLGDVNSLFCSPFLVNIILSQACYYSNYPEAFINPDVLSTRGQHFYNEARRHLNTMEGRINLTTVQGLAFLFLTTCLMGKDRVGNHYYSQTVHSIRVLLARSDEFIAQAGSQAQHMEQSIGLCTRGMFIFFTLTSISIPSPIRMKPPKREYLPITHDLADTWVTYPCRNQPVPAHRNCVHNQLFDLHLIAYDIVQYCYPGDQDEQTEDLRSSSEIEEVLLSFHNRLTHWYRSLPDCIKEGQSWTPGIIALHMSYHTNLITIFSYLKAQPSTSSHTIAVAQDRCTASAIAVCDLMKTFRAKWRRTEYQPIEFIQHLGDCLLTLMEDLSNRETKQAFVDLSMLARSMSRRFQFGRDTLRLVQLTALQHNVEIPEDAQQLYQDFDAEWDRSAKVDQFSSSYPNFSFSMRSLRARNGQYSSSSSAKNDPSTNKVPGLRGSSAELDLFLSKWDDSLSMDKDT